MLSIQRTEFPSYILHIARRRFALSLFYCQLLCGSASLSQRSLTSFGTLTDVALGYRPLGMTVGMRDSSRVTIAVLAPEQPAVNLFEAKANGRLVETTSLRTQETFRFITASDFDADGTSEYVAIASGGNTVVVVRKVAAADFEQDAIPLQSSVQKCIIADVNNDRRKDILLFGKNSAGVQTLLGQPNARFKPGPMLFPDISIADVWAMDINGDGISDLLAVNWLSDQLTVFYGIGRMVYTEQVAVQLPAEPADIAVAQEARGLPFRVALTLPESRKVQVYTGNAIGDYRLTTDMTLDARPAGIQFVDINGDGLPDVVTSTVQGIVVVLANSATTFAPPAVFGAAHAIVSWKAADVDGDGRTDCIIAERNSNRLIMLANAESQWRSEPAEYCVGASPQGLVTGDFNGDGREDIIVVNERSSSLSLLLGKGRGRFGGQIAVQIPDHPTHVRLVSPARERLVMTSHASNESVTLVSFRDEHARPQMFSVPTGVEPFVISARLDTATLRFLVRCRDPKDKSYMLSSFERISRGQFLERSFRALVPARIIAMLVNEETAGMHELLVASHNKTTKETTISAGYSAQSLEFTEAKALFSYIDSTASTRIVLRSQVNNDFFKEILVALGPPRNELGIWYGRTASGLRDSIEWIRGVHPVHDDDIIIRDVNNDAQPDITLLDALRRSVMTLYGTERRGFRQPAIIAPAEGVSAIRSVSLREPGSSDLIMTNAERGSVSVFFNPFIR